MKASTAGNPMVTTYLDPNLLPTTIHEEPEEEMTSPIGESVLCFSISYWVTAEDIEMVPRAESSEKQA